MILNKYKKIFSAIGILLILFLAMFLGQPKKVRAQVPVGDIVVQESTMIMVEELGSLVQKEYVLDTIAWSLVKIMVSNLIQSVTDWVRNGFEGNPLFITDVKSFLMDAGIEASGIFMEEYLTPEVYDFLCEPWRFEVGLALEIDIAGYDRPYPECTILDVINNAQGMINFTTDFRQGGWIAWLSMFDKPTNNPYGLYFHESMEMERRKQEAEENAETEAKMNQGFIGVKICAEWLGEDNDICERWNIESPGKWVEEQLAVHTTSGIRTLEIADELDELIGALAEQLLGWIYEGIAGGLGGTSPGVSSGSPAPIPVSGQQRQLNQIDQAIADEIEYKTTLEAITPEHNLAETNFRQALSCYRNYSARMSCAGGARANPERPSISSVQANISYNSQLLESIEVSRPAYTEIIERSEEIIFLLQLLRNELFRATTAEELQNVSNDFLILRQETHNAYDRSIANQRLGESERAKNNSLTQLNNCGQLPPACQGGGNNNTDVSGTDNVSF